MKRYISLFFILTTIFFFTGCEFENPFKPSKEELKLQEKELNAKIEQEQKRLNAKIEQEKKELNAKIEQEKTQLNVNKELELAKINSSMEKEKLLTLNKEKENLYKLQLQEAQSQRELQKYYIVLAALIVIVGAIALFIYFNNRRKDKLKAYEDNMEKYFKSKENDAKIKIANKIIDTVATGHLSTEQENLLIANLDGKEQISAQTLKDINSEDVVDIEVIEESTPPTEKKKKKKKKKKEKKKKDSKKSKEKKDK